MRGIEVLKALETGKKVRMIHWTDDHYVYLKEDLVVDELGYKSLALSSLYEADWELYDSRKELPEQLQWLKDAYKSLHTNNCMGLECETCPLDVYFDHNYATMCFALKTIPKDLNEEYKLDC